MALSDYEKQVLEEMEAQFGSQPASFNDHSRPNANVEQQPARLSPRKVAAGALMIVSWLFGDLSDCRRSRLPLDGRRRLVCAHCEGKFLEFGQKAKLLYGTSTRTVGSAFGRSLKLTALIPGDIVTGNFFIPPEGAG